MTRIVSIQRHLIETQHRHPNATGNLTGLLWDLTLAFKLISRAVNRAGLINILGNRNETNASGDRVTMLDHYAQEIIWKMMDHGGHLCVMASEEEEDIMLIPERFPKGKYTLAFDPLDGSSNIDVNVSVGTIFSINKRITPSGGNGTLEDILQPGTALVGAGYVVYGSSTMMVYSVGNGVHGFTLDPSVGEFLLSHPNIRIPPRGNIYSVNEGYSSKWDKNTQRYIAHVKSGVSGAYKGRYIGSMIADVHRTLLYGGIFLYPRTYENNQPGRAKLRLLYEAAPMAFLIEQAGGLATTGKRRILEVFPKRLHERCTVAMGSPFEVNEYLDFYQNRR